MSFSAKYRGRCTVCGGFFDAGEQVERADYGGYEHVSCPDDVILPDETPASCLACFMVLPCMCGYYESEKK